jgi:hypothetical protein
MKQRAAYFSEMVLFALLFFLPTLLCSSAVGQNPGSASKLERVEWTWAENPVKYDSALPNVLLVGDSISRNYYGDVAADLSGVANCFLFATSASSGSPRLERQLADYFADVKTRFAVLHINNGMHGWSYSEADYAAGLPDFLAAVIEGAPGASLVFALTTPVLKNAEGGATTARVKQRNAAVVKLAKANGIQIDDQFQLMLAHDDLHSDPVHYGPDGSRLEARQVADSIVAVLKKK